MPIPTDTQLMLPLLQTLQDHGGSARPKDVYDDVAAQFGMTDEDRHATVKIGHRKVNTFERRMRWCRQTAVLKKLIDSETRGVWRLTETANAKLGNIVVGNVVTFAISENGALLWAQASEAVTYIEHGSLQLLMTSSPYPLLKPKEYGNVPPDRWVGWMTELFAQWKDLLTPDGSILLNIGSCFKAGVPAQQLHVERLLVKLEDELGFHLLQRLDWHQPCRLPSPLKWVGIERMRVTSSVEPLLWLSPNPMAYGNNRHVLRSYSAGGLRSIAAPRLSKRPSGFTFGKSSFVDRGGSIPSSLIVANSSGKEETRYRKAVRAKGLEPHPAIMPAAVARFGIQLATDVGDVVFDPFCGSGTVVAESLKLGRRAIGSDRSLAYLESAAIRFQSEGLEMERLYRPPQPECLLAAS
jgi:DNA modification methylase